MSNKIDDAVLSAYRAIFVTRGALANFRHIVGVRVASTIPTPTLSASELMSTMRWRDGRAGQESFLYRAVYHAIFSHLGQIVNKVVAKAGSSNAPRNVSLIIDSEMLKRVRTALEHLPSVTQVIHSDWGIDQLTEQKVQEVLDAMSEPESIDAISGTIADMFDITDIQAGDSVFIEALPSDSKVHHHHLRLDGYYGPKAHNQNVRAENIQRGFNLADSIPLSPVISRINGSLDSPFGGFIFVDDSYSNRTVLVGSNKGTLLQHAINYFFHGNGRGYFRTDNEQEPNVNAIRYAFEHLDAFDAAFDFSNGTFAPTDKKKSNQKKRAVNDSFASLRQASFVTHRLEETPKVVFSHFPVSHSASASSNKTFSKLRVGVGALGEKGIEFEDVAPPNPFKTAKEAKEYLKSSGVGMRIFGKFLNDHHGVPSMSDDSTVLEGVFSGMTDLHKVSSARATGIAHIFKHIEESQIELSEVDMATLSLLPSISNMTGEYISIDDYFEIIKRCYTIMGINANFLRTVAMLICLRSSKMTASGTISMIEHLAELIKVDESFITSLDTQLILSVVSDITFSKPSISDYIGGSKTKTYVAMWIQKEMGL